MDRPSVWQVIFERDEKKKSAEKKKEKLFFTREFSGAVTQRLKRILSSRFLRFTKRVSEAIAQTSTRVYGTMLLCFGIVGVLMHYLHLSIDQDIASPIVGIVLSVLSIPLLLSDKPLPIFMQDFKPTDFLFFEFFCMKRHSFIENRRSIPTFVAMLIGFIPAVMSAFIPFWMVALIIGVVIGVYIGMESPEFIFLLSLISLPYLRFLPRAEMVFGIAILLAVISFARKVLYGRRVLYIEQYDFVIGAMLLFILVSGIFIKGEDSFSGSIRMIILALGYMLAGNIITNRRLAELSTNSIVVSGALASIISIVQFVVILINNAGQLSPDSLTSILARADGVAVFLIASIIFSAGMIKQSSRRTKGLVFIASALCFIALVLSGELLAVVSLMLGVIAYYVIKADKLSMIILSLLLCVPIVVLLLPNSFLNIIFEYSPSVVSAEELYDLWLKSATSSN